jgi:hypothetical protein
MGDKPRRHAEQPGLGCSDLLDREGFVVTRKLVSVSILFFVVAYAILSFASYRNYFCASGRSGHSHALTTARLALAFTAWNLFASSLVSLIIATGKKHTVKGLSAIALSISTVAGVGYGSVPFWIYRGYGTFWFENTWADVSCFFTEGYAIAFLILVAPALALTTLFCEGLFRIQSQ